MRDISTPGKRKVDEKRLRILFRSLAHDHRIREIRCRRFVRLLERDVARIRERIAAHPFDPMRILDFLLPARFAESAQEDFWKQAHDALRPLAPGPL